MQGTPRELQNFDKLYCAQYFSEVLFFIFLQDSIIIRPYSSDEDNECAFTRAACRDSCIAVAELCIYNQVPP